MRRSRATAVWGRNSTREHLNTCWRCSGFSKWAKSSAAFKVRHAARRHGWGSFVCCECKNKSGLIRIHIHTKCACEHFSLERFHPAKPKKQTQKLKTVASEDGSAAIASQISHPVYVNKTSNEFSSSDVFLPLYENFVPKESLSHEGNMKVKTVPKLCEISVGVTACLLCFKVDCFFTFTLTRRHQWPQL